MPSPLAIFALALVLALALAGLILWLRASLRELKPRPEDQQALAELRGQIGGLAQGTAQQMEALRSHVLQLQQHLTQSLHDTRKSMDDRLDGAARVMQGVNQNLGQLSEKTQRLAEIGRDIASLQDILRSPKLRGNVSELFLGDLLSQILPPDHYHLQYAFQGGETVDAVVKLKAGLVPVDAKFPLENFQRVLKAATDEEKRAARRTFVQDVKKHVDAITRKYIRPDEGTFDFALMYIPAENIYYETIIKDDDLNGEGALFGYALARRVIPVSPNSFYAYLQTILLGLKGLRVEESAREALDQLTRLHAEFGRFSEAFRLVGEHLDSSRKKYEEAGRRLDKVETKLAQIDGVVKGDTPPALGDGT